MEHILSLGVGVQSSTMLLMAAEGEIQPKPAAAIFGDTQEEPASVYRWLAFLLCLDLPIPIYVRTHGELGTDNLKRHVSRKSGNRYVRTIIPTYILNPNGSSGVLGRRCTGDYKIRVIEKTIRREVLKTRISKKQTEPLVCSWIGISTDEADRMKPSKLPWIQNRWPLIELEMSREDCKQWIRESRYYPEILEAGFREPPRSACKQCPYHSDAEWLRLKREEPEEFMAAVQWEKDYQKAIQEHCQVTKGTPFLHNSLVPLDQVVFDPQRNKRPMVNECEGMCGV